jgi:hypothetical protein
MYPNLGKFWRDLEWKMLVHDMAIWNVLQAFGIFLGYIFGNLVALLVYIFGILYLERSGNPDGNVIP